MTTYEMTPEQYETFCKTINPNMLTGYAIMDDLMVHRGIEGGYSKQYLTPKASLKGGIPGVGFSALQNGATGTVDSYFDTYGRSTKYVLETDDKTLEKAAKGAGAVEYEGPKISGFKPGKYVNLNEAEMKLFEKGGKFKELTPEEGEKMREYFEKTLKKPSVIPDNPYGPSARVTEEKFKEIGKGLRDLAKKDPEKYGKMVKEFTEEAGKLKVPNEFGGKAKITEYQIPPKVLEQIKQNGVLQKIADEMGIKKDLKQK